MVNSNQKSGVSLNHMWAVSKGNRKGRNWETGETFDQGLLRESYQEFIFACDCRLLSRALSLHEGTSVSVKSM